MRVFVTTELHPFTAGGIGRVIANILVNSSAEERERTLIVYCGADVDGDRFAAVYPGCGFIACEEEGEAAGVEQYPPKWAYTNTEWHWRSVLALRALEKAERLYGALDYVEFADWGGMAFAATQHKRLGLGLLRSAIAIRLHSTDAVISDHESRPPAACNLSLFDIERKALADADLIVGQLDSVSEAVRSFYGFPLPDWQGRLHLHAPPVVLDDRAPSVSPNPLALDTPIVFSSKLQHIKRPDIFVRGCAGFLRDFPSYRGKILFVARASDDAYADRIRRLIPEDLADRFEFRCEASQLERGETISKSVCVFPNAWESFCLAAYEASMLGATCVLNATTVAFSAQSPWEDGVNCKKFDGSPSGLASTLREIFESASPAVPEVVRVPANPAPWISAAASVPVAQEAVAPNLPRVSVIVPHYNLGRYVLRTLDSILASDYPDIEIVVVDDASSDAASRRVIERISELASDGLKVVSSRTNGGLAATRNSALEHATGEYVLPLDADDLIHPGFLRMAVEALERQPSYDFVVPQAGFFLDDAESKIDSGAGFSDYAIFHGEARYAGLFENRYSTATMLSRASVLRKFGYRADLESYEDWDLYQRMVGAGIRCLVTNCVQFFYRRRPESMIHNPLALERVPYFKHDLLRGKTTGGIGDLPLIVLGRQLMPTTNVSGPASALSPELETELEGYRKSEVVFASLTVARMLNRHAPWLLRAGKSCMRVAWRGIKRLSR